MDYILIAIYLAHGSAIPVLRTQEHTTLIECRDTAAQYMKAQFKGSKWAICARRRHESS